MGARVIGSTSISSILNKHGCAGYVLQSTQARPLTAARRRDPAVRGECPVTSPASDPVTSPTGASARASRLRGSVGAWAAVAAPLAWSIGAWWT